MSVELVEELEGAPMVVGDLHRGRLALTGSDPPLGAGGVRHHPPEVILDDRGRLAVAVHRTADRREAVPQLAELRGNSTDRTAERRRRVARPHAVVAGCLESALRRLRLARRLVQVTHRGRHPIGVEREEIVGARVAHGVAREAEHGERIAHDPMTVVPLPVPGAGEGAGPITVVPVPVPLRPGAPPITVVPLPVSDRRWRDV